MIATMRNACGYLLRPTDFTAGHFTAALASVWGGHGDTYGLDYQLMETHDPRWFYEVEVIRDRICVTVYDLYTYRAQPCTYPLTETDDA